MENFKATEKEFLQYIEQKKKDSFTTTEIALWYGYNAESFNKLLCSIGFQYKRRYKGKLKWILKKPYSTMELQELEIQKYENKNGEIFVYKKKSKWNKKGVVYLYYLLRSHGYKPLANFGIEDKFKIEQLSFI